MTSTNREWSANDPYAGQDLPDPPVWLPDAGDAVRVGAEVSPDTPRAKSGGPLLEKRSDAPVDARAAAPADTPGEHPADTDADDGSEAWEFVPLGIADPESADSREASGRPDPAAPAHGPPAEEEPGYVYDEFAVTPEPRPDVLPYAEPGLPGQHHFEDDGSRRPWALIALAGALVVLIAVIVVIFMRSGEAERKTEAKQPMGTSLAPQAMPSEAVGARPVPADRLPSFRPQSVAVGTFDGELQVTWDPPQASEAVSGYFVVTQSLDGKVDERVLIEKNGELTAVFDDPDLCVVVTTVVGTPEGLQLARGDLVCPSAASTGSSPTASQSRR